MRSVFSGTTQLLLLGRYYSSSGFALAAALRAGTAVAVCGKTAMRMLVAPKGTRSRAVEGPWHAVGVTGEMGGGFVMLLPRQYPHEGTRRAETRTANGNEPSRSSKGKSRLQPPLDCRTKRVRERVGSKSWV